MKTRADKYGTTPDKKSVTHEGRVTGTSANNAGASGHTESSMNRNATTREVGQPTGGDEASDHCLREWQP